MIGNRVKMVSKMSFLFWLTFLLNKNQWFCSTVVQDASAVRHAGGEAKFSALKYRSAKAQPSWQQQ